MKDYREAIAFPVLEPRHLEPIQRELEAVRPLAGAFYPEYVKRLNGTHVKQAPTKAAMVEQLQQDVEDVGVCLLDLVEEHHREGLLADLGREQALAGSGRGAPGEPGHTAGVGVLAHVEAQQACRIAEQVLGQGLGQLVVTVLLGPGGHLGEHGGEVDVLDLLGVLGDLDPLQVEVAGLCGDVGGRREGQQGQPEQRQPEQTDEEAWAPDGEQDDDEGAAEIYAIEPSADTLLGLTQPGRWDDPPIRLDADLDQGFLLDGSALPSRTPTTFVTTTVGRLRDRLRLEKARR